MNTASQLILVDSSESDQIEIWKSSTQVRTLVQKHSAVSLTRALSAICGDWLVIGLMIALLQTHFHFLFYIIGVVVIASRQHALAIMVHDAAHFRLCKNPVLNDSISDLLAAFPLLASTSWYRKHHTQHHKYLNSDKDPDWARKIHLPEWKFPKTKTQMFLLLAKQTVIGGFEWIVLMYKVSGLNSRETYRNRKSLSYLLMRICCYASVATVITVFNLWHGFLIYWTVPFLVVFPLIQRWRSISEHFAIKRTHDLNSARNVLSGPVEKFFLSPHGINFHVVHHLFPSVPAHNVARLHAQLMTDEVYAKYVHNNDSYLSMSPRSVWSDLTKSLA